MPNKEIEHITTLLGNYLNDIKLKGQFNWLSDHVHAEYFFKRLLNLLYDWKLSHTEEIFGHNTSDIDLVSQHTGVVVQITANSQPATKIKKTVTGYQANWQAKYPKLKIVFIQTDLDYEKYKSDDYELITYKRIKQRIQNLSPLDQRVILEFLRQELSNYYDSNPYSLSVIQKFRDSFISKDLGRGLINNFYSDQNLIHLSERDRKRIQIFESCLKNGKTKFAIIGPPCSGKTTLLFELYKVASEALIKVFYIDLEIHGNEDILILEELKKIGSQDALLIIDNAHDHAVISRKIFNNTIDHDIRSLFVYRKTPSDNLTDRLREEDFDFVETTDDELDNSNIEKKFIGIINKRIQYLKTSKKAGKWLIGDIRTVLNNNEWNFLKLSIALYYWEKDSRFQSYRLDQIKSEDVYESFYEEHLEHIESDTLIKDLFLYGNLYQYGIPFYLKSQHDDEIARKGFILKVPLAGTFIFPHTEYSKLLRQSIQHRKGFTQENVKSFLHDYISSKRPKNISLLLREFIKNEPEMAVSFLTDQNTFQAISEHYSKSTDYQSILILIVGLNEFKNELKTEDAESLLKSTFSDVTKIRYYERLGENLSNELKLCLNNYSISNTHLENLIIEPKSVRGEYFFEICTAISKKRRDEKFVYKQLQSRNYSTWKKLSTEEFRFGKIAEGITCLYNTIGSRQLALDIYQEIKIDEAYRNLKNQSIDVIGKALSDLSKLFAFDNKRKANQLLSLLMPVLKEQNFKEIGLSRYSIGVSHISKVNPSQLKELFLPEETLFGLLKTASANELSQRVIELITCFPNKEDVLKSTLKTVISESDFISRNSNDPRGLIKLIKQLQNLGFKISQSKFDEVIEAVSSNRSTDLLLLAEIGVFTHSLLKTDPTKFFDHKRIEYELAHENIYLTKFEQIVLSNAASISTEFAYKILRLIPVKAINISATRSTISFSQLSSVYYRLFQLEPSNSQNSHMNKALKEYFEYRQKNLENKAKKATSWHLIEGISKLYEINNEVTSGVLVPILIERVKEKKFDGATLTNLIQPLRRLNNLEAGIFKQLAIQILTGSETEMIRNSKLIDIGKISSGLRELATFNVEASKRIFEHMIVEISEKIKLESNRHDMANRIIPELEIASDYDIDRIAELKKIAGIN